MSAIVSLISLTAGLLKDAGIEAYPLAAPPDAQLPFGVVAWLDWPAIQTPGHGIGQACLSGGRIGIDIHQELPDAGTLDWAGVYALIEAAYSWLAHVAERLPHSPGIEIAEPQIIDEAPAEDGSMRALIAPRLLVSASWLPAQTRWSP